MGIFNLNNNTTLVDYRLPSLLPSARESRLFSHDQYTADAQSYANIIAFLQSNQLASGGGGNGGIRNINNNHININNESSVNQMINPTRNYDNRSNANNNYNNHNTNNNERKQNTPPLSTTISDTMPLFGLEELTEADIDSDSLIDGFFHSHYILPSSPLVLSHPLASSSTINNNNNNRHNNNINNSSGPIRHSRTRIPTGFSLTSSPSSNNDYYHSINNSTINTISINDDNNNNNNFIIEEELLPVEFLQPPSSSPQPIIDYQSITVLDGIQEFAAI